MCGIVAGVSYRNIVPILTEGLRRMEYRGYDSCGVAVVDDGQLKRSRTVKRVQDLTDKRKKTKLKVPQVLLIPDGLHTGHLKFAIRIRFFPIIRLPWFITASLKITPP